MLLLIFGTFLSILQILFHENLGGEGGAWFVPLLGPVIARTRATVARNMTSGLVFTIAIHTLRRAKLHLNGNVCRLLAFWLRRDSLVLLLPPDRPNDFQHALL